MLLSYQERDSIESFCRIHSTRMLVILFTDIVGSVELKSRLGDDAAKILEDEHRRLLYRALDGVRNAKAVRTEGDSYIFIFMNPPDAVLFSLQARMLHHERRKGGRPDLPDFRVGIHMGTVIVETGRNMVESTGIVDICGLQVDTAARIAALAGKGRILCSGVIYDDAVHALKGMVFENGMEPRWVRHGEYLLKGRDEPILICEIVENAFIPFQKPSAGSKAVPLGEGAFPVAPLLDGSVDAPGGDGDDRLIYLYDSRGRQAFRKPVDGGHDSKGSPVSFRDGGNDGGRRDIRFFGGRVSLWTLLSVLILFILVVVAVVSSLERKRSERREARSREAVESVERLKHKVISLRGTFETIDTYGEAASLEVRSRAHDLAERLLEIDESGLGRGYRLSKYEFAAYAFHLAAYTEKNVKEKMRYADMTIQAGEKGIAVIGEMAKAAASGGEYDQELYDWSVRGDREERIRYLIAFGYAVKAKLGVDHACESALEELDRIPSIYKERYPPSIDPNFRWALDLCGREEATETHVVPSRENR